MAEFTEPLKIPYEHLRRLFDEAQTNFPLSKANANKFSKLDEYVVNKFRIGFGNRILRQIHTFVPIYVASGGTEPEALDFMFASKILKKFRSLNLAVYAWRIKCVTAPLLNGHLVKTHLNIHLIKSMILWRERR